jgi:phosphatidylserine decarboxylase
MTSRETHPIIAKEGWPHVLIAAGFALLATWLLCWWSIPFWLLLVFVVQFFRDPRRVIPTAPGIVVAPADGRIVMVGRARDPYLDRDALKISIFMNVFNVHSNRSPADALVRKRWYHPGSFLNAALDKASAENERMALHLRTQDGIDITCVQIAGLVARRILCYANESDSLARGQRYGFIRFGSRVDLYLPTTATSKVSVGDVTMGGVTSVAELNG